VTPDGEYVDVNVRDEHPPEETFATCLEHTPQPCIDLVGE